MSALYISIIMLMRVLQSIYSKKAAIVLPDGLKPYISYVGISNLFSAVFAALLIVPTRNFSGINSEAVLIASISGIALALNTWCGVKALIGGTIALNSIFATAGMIIPVILGAVFFEETMSFLQIVSMIVLFVAIWLMVSSAKDTFKGFSIKTLWYLMGTFVTSGITMFCQKLFGELQPDGNVSMFSLLTFIVPAVVFYAALPFMNLVENEKKNSAKLPKSVLICAAILAFAVFMIQQLVTILTPVMSAAVLFTVVNGGATVIAAIVGVLMYKEKVTARNTIGIILGICAMVCIKIFE